MNATLTYNRWNCLDWIWIFFYIKKEKKNAYLSSSSMHSTDPPRWWTGHRHESCCAWLWGHDSSGPLSRTVGWEPESHETQWSIWFVLMSCAEGLPKQWTILVLFWTVKPKTYEILEFTKDEEQSIIII